MHSIQRDFTNTSKKTGGFVAGLASLVAGSLLVASSDELARFVLHATQQYGVYGLAAGLAVVGFIENWRRSQVAEKRAEEAEKRATRIEDSLMTELRRSNKIATERYDVLMVDFATYKVDAAKKLDTVTRELDETKRRLEAVVKDLRETKVLYEAEQRHSTRLENANKALQAVNDKLVSENRKLLEDVSKLQTLETRVVELERQVKNLQDEVERREALIQELKEGQGESHDLADQL